MTHIGWFEVAKSLFNLVWYTGLTIFYTYSFIVLPPEFKLQTMSILFAIFIVLSWIGTIPLIRTLVIKVQYFSTDIEDNILETLTTPSKRYRFIEFIAVCIQFYFFIIINPFSKDCGIYTEPSTELACVSMQIISWIMFLCLCIVALTIIGFIFLMIFFCFIYCRRRIAREEQMRTYHENPPHFLANPDEIIPPPGLFDHPIMVSATQFLERYVPIEHPQDDKCFICLETAEEDHNKEWTRLSCGHQSHRLCLADWYRYEQSCPFCRQAIEVNNVISI